MSTYTQEGGLFKIDTPLGEDVLLLRGFRGTEGISRLFRFELDLLSENPSISFPDIIGKNVTISLKQPDQSYRYINGIISRFAQEATEELFTAYTAEMVPWLWLLTRNADCLIFKKKAVPDIVTQVFSDLGFNDYTNTLQSSYEPREYCSQYRESSFNFVSRLMEWEGIFYFFKHEQGRHTLVMADSPTAHSPCPGQSSAGYVTVSGGPQEDVITGWRIEQELHAGKYSQQHFNFQTPTTNLMTSEPTVHEVGGNSKLEVYDYPGEHLTKSAGDSMARIRMQEIEAGHLVMHGASQCRMFISGYKFTLEEHPRKDMNTDYVLTEIEHTAFTDAYGTQRSPEGESYSNTFSCIPLSIPFRPARVTPLPRLHSLQTATVIGPAGAEINTDQFDRVQIDTPWDRTGIGTAWCRVAQQWAGNGYGALFIPRVGMEVYVDFEDGDPDHPVVVGCVYNGANSTPWALPGQMTRSGWLTHSTPGGGDGDFNMLVFDDAIGDELISVRARKDMLVNIDNDDTLNVGHDQEITITGNRSVVIENTDDDLMINKGDRNVYILNGNTRVNVAEGKYVLTAGKSIELSADKFIQLSVGQSSITLDPSGVTIKGLKIKIQGNTNVTVQGGLVKIN
jgi:type VI secretion system secreted protein VgrG